MTFTWWCYAAVLLAALRVLPVRLSVRLSILPVRAGNSKAKKKHRKIKIGTNVTQGMRRWNASFQLKRSKIKVTGRQKPHEIAAYLAYMFTYGQSIKRPQLRRRLQTRPNPSLGLGNWTDGRISCRHLAPTSFLVYIVCERRRVNTSELQRIICSADRWLCMIKISLPVCVWFTLYEYFVVLLLTLLLYCRCFNIFQWASWQVLWAE